MRSLVLLGASSVQIAFYLETGSEIKWGAAGNFVSDPAAMRLLLSGGFYAFLVSVVIVVIAFFASQVLYDGTFALLSGLTGAFTNHRLQPRKTPKQLLDDDSDTERGTCVDSTSSQEDCLDSPGQNIDRTPFESETLLLKDRSNWTGRYSKWISRTMFIIPFTTVLFLLYVRPRTFPYAHMSASLPLTLRDIWGVYSEGLCQTGDPREFGVFPLPELISSEFWEQPSGRHIGWMPTANMSLIIEPGKSRPPIPSWLPEEKIHGFDRWYDDGQAADLFHVPENNRERIDRGYKEGVSYDPMKDPVRITNLDQDLLLPIKEALALRKIAIKHVVIIHLESTRKDVFPFKKDSHLHSLVMKSHTSNDSIDAVNRELSKLTINAEQLTGEASGFRPAEVGGLVPKSSTWRELSKEKGGINVVGAFTGSTMTFKSMVGSHCGAQPLPVDFTVEARGHIYQPCIPDILKLFNHNKKSQRKESRGTTGKDFDSKPWKSVFVQSITDQYDYQDELNEHMGFSEVIVKSTIDNPASKYFPPTEKESNYFGYPETQVKDYMRDLFLDAEKNNERLFLSHFTSSTHHPWKTPEAAGETFDFLKRRGWRSEHELNRYLNTIRYGDRWIGQVMDMIEEVGVAQETLVVMIGDQ